MLSVRYCRCLTTFLFENSADCTLAGAGHSDVIKRMIFTCVTDVEPGVKQFSNPASKRSELIGDEIHSFF